ncbi:MAG: DUF3341 domain-containing protein [Vicinamibacterales bacterium]
MSHRIVVAVFERETDIVAAARRSRERGFVVADAYTPYAVHGLDRAMGLRPSWMPWACLAFGALGLGFATWFQFWTTAVAWPINVGGRPWNSLPAFAPVMFELMVLCAGIGVVLTFLVARGLGPGSVADMPDAAITHDRFVLVLEPGASDPRDLRRLLTECQAVAMEEREVEATR